MSTKTKSIDALTEQADAARAEADRLAAEVSAAEAARDERERAAVAAEATWRHEVRTKELGSARDDAEATWRQVLGSPDTTLSQLFEAWMAMRVSSGLHYHIAMANGSNADTVLGMAKIPHGYMKGQDRPRPRPMHDYAAETSWEWAVRKHLEMVTAAAVSDELTDYATREDAARTRARTEQA